MHRLVLFGDSITQGDIGASYAALLQRQLAPAVHVFNAGINGDTIVNLLRRVERDVVARQPDLVVVLVGLNDIGTMYATPLHRLYYHVIKRVRQPISLRRYLLLYARLLKHLTDRTRARVALCTLTTLGEHPADPLQPQVDAYSHVVRGLADRYGTSLIDLRAAFSEAIARDPRRGPGYRIWWPPFDRLRTTIGRQSYNTLAAQRGFRLLIDGVHLSDAGAALVASTMLPAIAALLQHTDAGAPPVWW